ncbi:G1/S-specific cyclin-D1 [Marmota marmota marmota]|nr:G1/S-specific cyclin-D1 [Marmota marmota marmota]
MAHQLLCCEVESIRRAYPDTNLLNDRVLRAMLKAEETCAPSVSYFKCVQKEILPSMRKIVATWMLEVRGFSLLSYGRSCHIPTHSPFSRFPADVKFISNPPSMVAAGSVVAAVQGLHLGSPNTFLSCYRLTHFLSRVIKCDPDCLRACQEQIEALLESSLRQAQQNLDPKASEEEVEEAAGADLACTPTDVRDVDV